VVNSVPKIVLASASPRRETLLRQLGLSFVVIPSDIQEVIDESLAPAQLVTELASQKANFVAQSLPVIEASKVTENQAQTIVIGADTIVVLDKKILGKPNTKEEAIEMLSFLSGMVHEVYTGIAMIVLKNDGLKNDSVTESQVSKVRFKQLRQAEIEAYVATQEPMDKAGAYALQGIGAAFVESIEGCYTNVIGLPIPTLVQMLRNLGVTVLGLAKIC